MRKQFGRLQLIRLQPETILGTGLGITLSDTYDQCVIEWYLFGTVYAPWPHAKPVSSGSRRQNEQEDP